MSKGQQIQLKFESFNDSDTNATVTRITPKDVTCHRNYFYQKCFSNDGQRLIFGGAFERRDLGPWAAVRGIVTAGGAP